MLLLSEVLEGVGLLGDVASRSSLSRRGDGSELTSGVMTTNRTSGGWRRRRVITVTVVVLMYCWNANAYVSPPPPTVLVCYS